MKKIVFCSILAISFTLSNSSWSQEFAGGLLGGQGGGANNGAQPPNQAGGLRGAIREQIQNAIQPNLPGGQNAPTNVQAPGNGQVNRQAIGSPIQGGLQPGGNVTNTQSILNNQPGAGTSIGSQAIGGMLRTNQPSAPQSNANTSQLGWSLGTRNNGVFISSLVSNGMAAQAGLRAGDQIVSINGNPVGRSEDIPTYLLQANGSATTIVYYRNGQSGEAYLNASNQNDRSRIAPQSIQAKLDQIERLIGEIRAELASAR